MSKSASTDAKLTEAQIEEYREALLSERETLVHQIRTLSSASLTSNRQAGEELADVGSDDFIRETELALVTEEGQRLSLINLALENLDNGSYGVCIDCDKPIGVGRLRAKPYARLCIDCKMVREANEGLPPEAYGYDEEDLVE